MGQRFWRLMVDTPHDSQKDGLHVWIDRSGMVEILYQIAEALECQHERIELEFWGTMTQEDS